MNEAIEQAIAAIGAIARSEAGKFCRKLCRQENKKDQQAGEDVTALSQAQGLVAVSRSVFGAEAVARRHGAAFDDGHERLLVFPGSQLERQA